MKHKTYYYEPAKLKMLSILPLGLLALSFVCLAMTVLKGVSAYATATVLLAFLISMIEREISFMKKNPCIKFKDGNVITFSKDGQQTIRFEDICETRVSNRIIEIHYVYNGMRVKESIRVQLLSDEGKAELSVIFEPNLIAYRVA